MEKCAKKVVVEELVVCWCLCGCCLLQRSNFGMPTTHKLQVNKHTTMKIEVIVSLEKLLELNPSICG
jgi:hypothetical protein